jgi:16S rRNA (guanine527-N7)-methyltransferase
VTEENARSWLRDRYGPDRFARLQQFVDLLLVANAEQNLISKASEATVWSRHILDSAQLHQWAADASEWLDVGSGAGLPGLVLAIISDTPMLLVEPRRKRVEFLHVCAEALGLRNLLVRQAQVERVRGAVFSAVTARAYAPLPELFASTIQLTAPSTVWVLPKGRSAERELAEVRLTWQGVFHVEQSLTDPDARIIVAREVRAAA